MGPLVLAMDAEAWVMVFLVIAAGVTGMLYALSGTIRDFRRMQVLRDQVAAIRRKQAERVAALRARELEVGEAGR